MKIFNALWFVFLTGVSAHAGSDAVFLMCNADNGMQLTMSFDPAERFFSYMLSENGRPSGFHARPERGWGFENSSVTYAWNSVSDLEFKAQILGGNQLNPKFLYSAVVKLKDLGLGNLKLESIEVLHHEQSQRLIWFVSQPCKVHQGFP